MSKYPNLLIKFNLLTKFVLILIASAFGIANALEQSDSEKETLRKMNSALEDLQNCEAG